MREISPLEKLRLKYEPAIPSFLKKISSITFEKSNVFLPVNEKLQKLFPNTYKAGLVSLKEGSKKDSFPLKIGVVFSGGQAPGGHNVIAGLFDAISSLHKDSILYGFLDGPSGIVENKHIKITKELIAKYRNVGGFDLIGSGRTKIETKDQLAASLKTVKELKLDGLVIIGGDDSNTNAAILAEYFLQNKCETAVAGVPKTIDGDLRSEHILTPFGFDTACKVYSEMIGNIAKDALSAKKYYHFIKLMGRSASHIALECALKTAPNYTFIGEEVAKEKKTLKQLINELTDLICKRALNNKNYGVILIPEGLIEFIPEIKLLIKELNSLLPTIEEKTLKSLKEKIVHLLSKEAKTTFESLDEKIQDQLLLDRDPHGNIQVSKIDTEKLLIEGVKKELKKRSDFKGKFNGQDHFFGYEGRASFPSNFDANYCYALGFIAASLIKVKLTGYICAVYNLTASFEKWEAKAVPIVDLMHLEIRSGEEKPVIKKALVDLNGKAYKHFALKRKLFEMEDNYLSAGPLQFYGEKEITDSLPLSLTL
jgi:pyrophosphate--fructose-6-phosphate 1-phosphotransferase